ncbi:MAG: ABC transporter ATP-binding protein [Okeania sp. SIO3B3]|nr:ABC transporter ATP-binding protein [Okeania sp. SIO3B3]
MKNIALNIDNLSFSYSDKANVINDISIKILERENIGLVGSNGSGKTTLFLLICGVLEPSGGKIQILGENIQIKKFNPNVGFVFQNTDDQLFSPTVYDDIAFGLYNIGLNHYEVKEKVISVLKKDGLEQLIHRPNQHLSGGEKRKVCLATIQVMDPKIIILDEPTSNLDMRARRELITYFNRLNVTKLISSHDLEFIIETCDKTLLLKEGKIIAYDDTKKLLSNPKLMDECHQEVPYSLR